MFVHQAYCFSWSRSWSCSILVHFIKPIFFSSSASTSPLPIPSFPSCLSCPLLIISLPFPVSSLALMTPLHYSLASPTCTPPMLLISFLPISVALTHFQFYTPSLALSLLAVFLLLLLFSVTCFPFLSAFPQSSLCIFQNQILSSKVFIKESFSWGLERWLSD